MTDDESDGIYQPAPFVPTEKVIDPGYFEGKPSVGVISEYVEESGE